jgi:hypothetical protein
MRPKKPETTGETPTLMELLNELAFTSEITNSWSSASSRGTGRWFSGSGYATPV